MICKICNNNVNIIGRHVKIHGFSGKEYYDKYVKKSNNEGICLMCGKSTVFIGITYGYRKHCSNTCAQLNPKTRDKYAKTCLKKYGATNVYASDYGKEQIKKTCLAKYGTEYAIQSDEVKIHIKQTNLAKYGVENPQQNKEIKEKTSQTNLDRYGNKCAVHDPKIWKKAVHTMKKKW